MIVLAIIVIGQSPDPKMVYPVLLKGASRMSMQRGQLTSGGVMTISFKWAFLELFWILKKFN